MQYTLHHRTCVGKYIASKRLTSVCFLNMASHSSMAARNATLDSNKDRPICK